MTRTRADSRKLQAAVAASLGAGATLRPVLPELFADLDALGSMPSVVVRAVARAGVKRGQRVADLACGKGAVGLALAEELGVRVVGIDACREFTREASAHARARGVADVCTFGTGDVATWRPRTRFDAAVMIGLFGAEEATRTLRGLVREGGIYAFDDAVLRQGSPRGGAMTLAEVRAMVLGEGDQVLSARLMDRRRVAAHIARTTRVLERNAATLEGSRPELRRSLRAFVRAHQRAAELLTDRLAPALVVVRRGP
jgi:SAM-dependent methyltransferase